MTTPIEEFNKKPCCQINAGMVNAYVDISLDPDNPTGIILDSSWGTIKLDLLSIVKAGETVTHLTLTENGLCYEREDGEMEYISGDDLSRIISMKLLKDVDQDQTVEGGNVYMYNSTTNLFEPFDLQTFVNDTNTHLGRIDATLNQYNNRITNLENRMTAVENRISDIESIIPFYPADKTMKIARGTINWYSDVTNSMDKTDGLFTHDKNTNKINDQYGA